MARGKRSEGEPKIPQWPHIQVRIHPEQYTRLHVHLVRTRKTLREFFREYLDSFLKSID